MTEDHDWVEQCLVAALDQLDAGGDVDLQALCAERPHLLPTVAEALGLRDAVAALEGAAPPAPGDQDRWCGRILADRYELGATIGRGAAGSVHRALDRELQREVAVKLVRPGVLGGADTSQRFSREARLLAALSHPHVVQVHDVGTTADGQPFLVTELLQGHSLQAILAASQAAMPDGPSAAAFGRSDWLDALLPAAELDPSYLRQVVTWCAELGEGLAAAHELGIAHRDVKPGNAFVRPNGSAALLDFGIAARPDDPQLTLDHAIVGTPCYMAPEQTDGRAPPTAAIDIYGLTATLYHLLTLRPPHSGNFATVLLAVRREDPVPAGWVHAGLPVDLQAILDRGLERDPRCRYPTMRALVADLRAFLEHRPVVARPLTGMQRMWRKARRQPARYLATLTAILLVVTLTMAAPAWAALSAAAAIAEQRALYARLPPQATVENLPAERVGYAATEHEAILRDLSRLIELDDDDASLRIVRAHARLDAGDLPGAQRDARMLAALATSPLTEAVAARFAAATTARGLDSVDLEGLPEPASPVDCFVAGYHLCRARRWLDAAPLLDRAGDYLPAQDLRLLTRIAALDPADPTTADRLFTDAAAIERARGAPTARTLHARAVALLQARQFTAAAPLCERVLELCPDNHGALTNLGTAELRLGRAEQALDHLERAVAVRPWMDNSKRMRAQALRALARFPEARDAAAEIADPRIADYERANVDMGEAFAAWRHDRAAAASLAAAAADRYAAVGGGRATAMASYARAFAAGDAGEGLSLLLEQLRGNPMSPVQLGNLSDMLAADGATLSGEPLLRLRQLLVELARDAAPDDQHLRQLGEELSTEIRRATEAR